MDQWVIKSGKGDRPVVTKRVNKAVFIIKIVNHQPLTHSEVFRIACGFIKHDLQVRHYSPLSVS